MLFDCELEVERFYQRKCLAKKELKSSAFFCKSVTYSFPREGGEMGFLSSTINVYSK